MVLVIQNLMAVMEVILLTAATVVVAEENLEVGSAMEMQVIYLHQVQYLTEGVEALQEQMEVMEVEIIQMVRHKLVLMAAAAAVAAVMIILQMAMVPMVVMVKLKFTGVTML